MGRFNKIFHHISTDDVKKKHQDNITQLRIEEENKIKLLDYTSSTMEKVKYDWRSKDNSKNLLREKMTTSAVMSTTLHGDEDNPVEVATIDTSLEGSFEDSPVNGLQNMMFKAVTIKDGGSGSGADGGFDIGKHLAFSHNANSDGSAYQSTGSRHALLAPIDATNIDTITITAIRGNDSNGGELPDEPGEELRLMWFNPDPNGTNGVGDWMDIDFESASPTIRHNDIDPTIIPKVPGDIGGYDGDSPGLRDWTITIPDYCKNKNQRFALWQLSHSGQQYDHYGITAIKYHRKSPLTVFVPLDSPEAASFIRVGQPASLKSSAKKRKKKIEDMLAASKKYTEIAIGKDFPGMGTVLDPSSASPIGKDEVAQVHKDAGTLSQQLKKALGKDIGTEQEVSPVVQAMKDVGKDQAAKTAAGDASVQSEEDPVVEQEKEETWTPPEKDTGFKIWEKGDKRWDSGPIGSSIYSWGTERERLFQNNVKVHGFKEAKWIDSYNDTAKDFSRSALPFRDRLSEIIKEKGSIAGPKTWEYKNLLKKSGQVTRFVNEYTRLASIKDFKSLNSHLSNENIPSHIKQALGGQIPTYNDKGEVTTQPLKNKYGVEYDPKYEMSDEIIDRLKRQRMSSNSLMRAQEQAPYSYKLGGNSITGVAGEGMKTFKIWGNDTNLYEAQEYTYWDGSGWTPSHVGSNHWQGHAADGYFGRAMRYLYDPELKADPERRERFLNSMQYTLKGRSIGAQIAYYRNFGKTSWKFAKEEPDGKGGTRRVPGYYMPGETYYQSQMEYWKQKIEEAGGTFVDAFDTDDQDTDFDLEKIPPKPDEELPTDKKDEDKGKSWIKDLGLDEPIFTHRDSKKKKKESMKGLLANELKNPNKETANLLDKLGKAGETFARYITNTLPDVIDNKYLGNKYVNSMIKNAEYRSDGTLGFGDNILGTTGKPRREGDNIIVPFNYDFNHNSKEFAMNKENLNLLQKTLGRVVHAGLGPYSMDASPKLFGKIPIVGGAADLALGAVFSKAIETGKVFGGSKHKPGELKINVKQLKKDNPALYDRLFVEGLITGKDDGLVPNSKKQKVVKEDTTKRMIQWRKKFEYEGKPSSAGFPDTPQVELDPKTQMHPNYGKHSARYKKLDPASANAMPKTGDPETDAIVAKQKTKKKTFNNIKEDWTNVTSGNKVGQTFRHVSGATIRTGGALGGVETIPTSVTVDGETLSAPPISDYGLQGHASPIDGWEIARKNNKKKAKQINAQLDASEKVAKKAKADKFMGARVEDIDTLKERAKKVLKYKEELKKHEVKLDIRARDIDKMRNTRKSKINKFLRKYAIGSLQKPNINNVKWSPTPESSTTKWESYTVSNGKLIIIKSNGVFWNDGTKISAEVYSNYKQKGNQFYDISGLDKSDEFNIKEPSLPKEPEPPEFMKKNLSKGWQIVTEGDEEFIKKQEKNILFNVKHLYPGAELAGKLAIQMAKGDTTDFTKSPGKGFDKQVMNLIGRQIDNNIKGNVITDDVYGKAGTLEKGLDLPVRLSIGQFTWNKTSEGIEVYDNFDFDLNTAVGYGGFIPGLQKTANKFVGIMMRRSAELGFNMKSGKTPINPVYEGEEDYYGGLVTPDGFDIDVRYTIPWNKVSPELQSKLGRSTPKGEEKVKSTPKKKSKRDALSLDEPIIRDKKKKKVNESKSLSKIKNQFSYKGQPSADGFPDSPPPEMKDGWHPRYGKNANRYKKLDPDSANAMPKTGDAETDAIVAKQKNKFKKIKVNFNK